MNVGIIHEIGKNPTLEILVADLEIANLEISRLYDGEGDDSEYLASCERRWPILKAINATPALTLTELKLKAKAAEIELERDAEYCEGPGSFIEMTRSIIADLSAMDFARKEPVLRVVPGVGQ